MFVTAKAVVLYLCRLYLERHPTPPIRLFKRSARPVETEDAAILTHGPMKALLRSRVG